jgi:hypothetical protein
MPLVLRKVFDYWGGAFMISIIVVIVLLVLLFNGTVDRFDRAVDDALGFHPPNWVGS